MATSTASPMPTRPPEPLPGFYDCSLFITRIAVNCEEQAAFGVLTRIQQDFEILLNHWAWEDGTLTVLGVANDENDSLERQADDLRKALPGMTIELRFFDVTNRKGWNQGWTLYANGEVTDMTGVRTTLTEDE